MLVEKIGQGAYGEVYKGCLNKMCRYKYAAKDAREDMSLEYRIGLLAYKVAPGGVVKPYKYVDGILYTQYVPLAKITPRNFNKVFKTVLTTLMKLQKKYPSFRHNDLNHNNVFVDKDGNAFIGDFGLANIQLPGYKNPTIQSNDFKESHGTYPNCDPRFDIHFFLNSLYLDGSPSIKKIVRKYLPREYLGVSGPKLATGRLRVGVSHKSLPTMRQLFSMVTINEQKR